VREVIPARTPHYEHGRNGRRPEAVVVHTNVGGFESTLAWFADSRSRVSAHYLVGLDGRVASFVPEEDTARHAGRVLRPTAALAARWPDPNRTTIGVEFEDGGDPYGVERTAEQYEAGARLLGAIAGRWEIPLDRTHVLAHRELFAAKDCPGNLDVDLLVEVARTWR
jgi:N-acetylmuramoyl-L-alanine amidase